MKKYSLLLLLLLIPYYAFATEDASAYPSLSFTKIDDTTCSVKANPDNNPTGEVVIPSTILNEDGKIYSVTKLAEMAFYDCTIMSISLPSSITDIGKNALRNTRISSVVIPASVTSIGEYAFGWCSNLKTLIFRNATPPNANEDIVCESMYNNGFKVYVPEESQIRGVWEYDRTDLSSPGIFPGDLYVKTYDHFEGDYPKLVFTPIDDATCSVAANPDNKPTGEVVIPSTILKKDGNIYSVTKVPANAFQECPDLTSVMFPESVTSVEGWAFINCSAVKSLLFRSASCPVEELSALNGVNSSCAVYVPEAGKESYVAKLSALEKQIKGYVDVAKHSGLKFNPIDDTTCLVKATGPYAISGEVVIPSIVLKDGKIYTVTTIEGYGFDCCRNITKVVIPQSITSIGQYAFRICNNLNSLIFLGGCPIGTTDWSLNGNCKIYVPSDKKDSFEARLSALKDRIISYFDVADCEELIFTPITGKEGECSVKKANSSIKGVDGKLVIPSTILKENDKIYNVTSIESYAFSYCEALTSVDIPNSITSIGEYAFSNCRALTLIEIPSSVTKIGGAAFSYCEALTSVEIPNSVTSIGDLAFSYCKALTSINIPSSVTSIGVGAFQDCTSLTSVDIPSSVTSIGNSAFYGCALLTSVEIPSSVTSIGSSAFYGCALLTSINIPSSVTSIGASAFRGCSSLTSVEIPSSVTSIGSSAFYGCALSKIVIPANVEFIGWDAFPPSMKKIIFLGESCPELDKWDKGGNGPFTPMGEDAEFYVRTASYDDYKTKLMEHKLSGGKLIVESQIKTYDHFEGDYPDLVFTLIDGKEGECSVKAANLAIKVADIPSTILKEDGNIYTVISIEKSAFSNCMSLKSIEIPSTINSIGEYAFDHCNFLTSIEIPSSVTTIGDWAFQSCESLTSVEIPSSVTEIGKGAFAICSALTSFKIPNSVTAIGMNAFAYCSQLKSLIFMGETCPTLGTDILDNSDKYTVYVPEKAKDSYLKPLADADVDASCVKGYVDAADCEELVFTPNEGKEGECSVKKANSFIEGVDGKLVIPSAILKEDGNIYNVTSIKNLAFSNCKSLVSVEIPSSVVSIGQEAFLNCEKLTTVNIPSSVTSIEGEAFRGCSSLASVEIPSSVTKIGNSTFMDCFSLASVGIPSTVTSIEEQAFMNCSKLTSVVIPSSVTSIGDLAFTSCTGLKSLIFMGKTCPDLASDAFYMVYCTVYVPNKTLVESFKEKFPDNEVKPLLDITTKTGTYVKTEEPINLELMDYPEGYAPTGLVYSVTDGNSTIVDNVITGHGVATVRVADAGNADIYAETTLNVYLSGDSNDDGTVDITDAVNTANYIVGNKPDKFLEIAADVVVSDPAVISVADVVATVDIVLAAPATEPSEASNVLYAPANSADRLTLRAGTEGIVLSLAGEGVFSALQADIELPASAVLNGVIAGDRLTGNHSVMYRMVDDRTVRVAVFSLSLDTFVPGDAVVMLDVEGLAGDVEVKNVIASDADGHGHRLGVDGGGMTGIEGVVPGDGAVVKATVGGIIVEGAQGMAVEVYGMDGRMVGSFTAVDDRITVDVAPGVYAVRIGNASAVKIAVR